MSHVVRIDPDVAAELKARRLPSERNYSDAIRRALRERDLEAKQARVGLSSFEMGELYDLRALLDGRRRL